MTGWLKSNISHKLTALLIAGVFVVVTFACFTMATDHGHGLDVGAACETVMTLADNAVIQTGLVLLLVVAAACLCFRSFNTLSFSDTLTRLQVFHSPPSNYFISPQEYSYLQKLFSSGVIHAKLHSVTS
tara:strand:- start:719 stop:1105 length:387 start_codon:yes stop_codon:yes gene_type:complete